MGNITITNVDQGNVILSDARFRDDSLYFASTETVASGTILARKAVATSVTVAAGSNTGTGTCTAASVVAGPVVPLVGAYVLTCTAAVSHGGVFKLVDPNGALVSGSLAMAAGAGVATVFEVGGLTFTLTDSGDFIVGDSFTLTVAEDGKLVPYVIGGLGGAQFPLYVLTYDVAGTSGQSTRVRVMRAGEVRKGRLIVHADGDDSNITETILDQLNAAGILAQDVTQLAQLDNQ